MRFVVDAESDRIKTNMGGRVDRRRWPNPVRTAVGQTTTMASPLAYVWPQSATGVHAQPGPTQVHRVNESPMLGVAASIRLLDPLLPGYDRPGRLMPIVTQTSTGETTAPAGLVEVANTIWLTS